MNKTIPGIILAGLFFACSPAVGDKISDNSFETPATEIPITANLDLVNISNDRVWVEVNPGSFKEDSIIFRLPRVVQGTYKISNFGAFTDNFVAYDYTGNEMEVKKTDENSWVIPNASQFDKLGYYVNDTFDIENSDKKTPFSPSGTNISPQSFVLNLHGFVGFFEEMESSEYLLNVTAPSDLKNSSALELLDTDFGTDSSTVTHTYTAGRYFDVTDNPMMYGDLSIEEFMAGDIKIVLSVFSQSDNFSAVNMKDNIERMMLAQKNYLGDLNSTSRYDVFVYLTNGGEGQPTGFGALEHHTSTIVVLPTWLNQDQMDENMTDIVSHEFFHVVTPLTIHSEDVQYFDYNDPTFSKHLWLYEGVTEYFATHFQVFEDLQSRDDFYEKIQFKIDYSERFDDTMSFTEMSENIIDEPYASNFINVYMKGALIGMCIDILMREESNGERSMLSLLKELSVKYGMNRPFEDDKLLEEIEEMTYSSVGNFLQTHVAGNTPIPYEKYFEKVGLTVTTEEIETSLFFKEKTMMQLQQGQSPFIDVNDDGRVYFPAMDLNTSLVELGVVSGDIIKSVNRTEIPDLNSFQNTMLQSFSWEEDTELTIVVERDGAEEELKGVVGSPLLLQENLREISEPSEEQIQLRNFWLEGN